MANEENRMQQIMGKMDTPTDKPNMNGRVYSEESVQQLVKNMRVLNEELEEKERVNLKTPDDQAREEENLNKDLEPFNVLTKYVDLEVYNDYVFWGGIVDGYIKFSYRVPALPGQKGVTFSYNKEGFNVDDEDNEAIVEAIENYYATQFFQYWSENILQNRDIK